MEGGGWCEGGGGGRGRRVRVGWRVGVGCEGGGGGWGRRVRVEGRVGVAWGGVEEVGMVFQTSASLYQLNGHPFES